MESTPPLDRARSGWQSPGIRLRRVTFCHHRTARGDSVAPAERVRRRCPAYARRASEEDVSGSARPTPDRAAPVPATGWQHQGQAPGQRGHHPGARPRRARGRAGRRARQGHAPRPCDLPGRRAAGARGALPDQRRHRGRRGAQGRAAQAPRRHRHDPGQDRGPRHLAAAAARRGRRGLRRRPRPAPPDAQAGRHRRPRGGRAAQARHGRDLVAAPRRAPVGHRAPAGQPVPRARLLRRRAQPRRRRAGWPTGSSSSPSSSPSSTSAAARPPA